MNLPPWETHDRLCPNRRPTVAFPNSACSGCRAVVAARAEGYARGLIEGDHGGRREGYRSGYAAGKDAVMTASYAQAVAEGQRDEREKWSVLIKDRIRDLQSCIKHDDCMGKADILLVILDDYDYGVRPRGEAMRVRGDAPHDDLCPRNDGSPGPVDCDFCERLYSADARGHTRGWSAGHAEGQRDERESLPDDSVAEGVRLLQTIGLDITYTDEGLAVIARQMLRMGQRDEREAAAQRVIKQGVSIVAGRPPQEYIMLSLAVAAVRGEQT